MDNNPFNCVSFYFIKFHEVISNSIICVFRFVTVRKELQAAMDELPEAWVEEGAFSVQEDEIIVKLHNKLGNKFVPFLFHLGKLRML